MKSTTLEYHQLKDKARALGFTVRLIPNGELRDYAGMNPLAGKTMGFKMPADEIWIKRDLTMPAKFHTLKHELVEMALMKQGESYFNAHDKALQHEALNKMLPNLNILRRGKMTDPMTDTTNALAGMIPPIVAAKVVTGFAQPPPQKKVRQVRVVKHPRKGKHVTHNEEHKNEHEKREGKMKRKELPALTLSGGKLSEFGGHKSAKGYRVWVNPKKGDDYFYDYPDYEKALIGKDKHEKEGKVENPIAVVFDSKHKQYREVHIDKTANQELLKPRISLAPKNKVRLVKLHDDGDMTLKKGGREFVRTSNGSVFIKLSKHKAQKTGLTSIKKGQIFHTPVRGGVLLSRHSLRRNRRK